MHKYFAPASLFFCQHRGNFRTSTQYFRPNFCTSTHAAAPSVVYLYVAKKLLQWEHKRCIFTEYRPVIYTLFNLPILFMCGADKNFEECKQYGMIKTKFSVHYQLDLKISLDPFTSLNKISMTSLHCEWQVEIIALSGVRIYIFFKGNAFCLSSFITDLAHCLCW